MLKLNQQQKWIEWPEAGSSFLLRPLTVSKRQQISAEATVEKPGKKKPEFDQTAFAGLVADHCILDWKGISGTIAEGVESPVPCTPENRRQLMEIELASIFIFTHVQGLAINIDKAADAAGKGLPPASSG